jgi:uncharacterized membrane protein YkvA (DUF1232 family)
VLKPARSWLEKLKIDVLALWFCYRHAQTPLVAKILAAFVVAYAFSPIDLIPDFIPVLGYLDDALLLPLGVWLVIKLIPQPVFAECRADAARWLGEERPNPRNRIAAIAIIALWLFLVWLAWRWVERWFA